MSRKGARKTTNSKNDKNDLELTLPQLHDHLNLNYELEPSHVTRRFWLDVKETKYTEKYTTNCQPRLRIREIVADFEGPKIYLQFLRYSLETLQRGFQTERAQIPGTYFWILNFFS